MRERLAARVVTALFGGQVVHGFAAVAVEGPIWRKSRFRAAGIPPALSFAAVAFDAGEGEWRVVRLAVEYAGEEEIKRRVVLAKADLLAGGAPEAEARRRAAGELGLADFEAFWHWSRGRIRRTFCLRSGTPSSGKGARLSEASGTTETF